MEEEKAGRDILDKKYSAQRANLSSMETKLLATVTHFRPGVLFGGKGRNINALQSGGDSLEAYKNYQRYIGDGVSSYSQSVGALLHGHLSAVHGMIDPAEGDSQIAHYLPDAIQSQWLAFNSHIERFNTKLASVAKFTPANAWRLIGRTLGTIFELQQPYQHKIRMIFDLSTPANMASVLWAVLQCHRVVNKFVDLLFEGHSVFVREMGLLIITERVDPEEIIKLSIKVKKAEESVVKAATSTINLEDRFTVLKHSFNSFKNSVEQIKKKV